MVLFKNYIFSLIYTIITKKRYVHIALLSSSTKVGAILVTYSALYHYSYEEESVLNA